MRFKFSKPYGTSIGLSYTKRRCVKSQDMMYLFIKSKEDLLDLRFLGVINVNFLLLFDSLEENYFFKKPSCTSIWQLLSYSKRWRSYSKCCKISPGDHTTDPRFKKYLKSDHTSKWHSQLYSCRSFHYFKNCDVFETRFLLKKSIFSH